MTKEELNIRMRQLINGIYSSQLSLLLLVLILICGLTIFSQELSLHSLWPSIWLYKNQDNYINSIKEIYIFIIIMSIIVLILYYWPRQFDNRELDLYDKYLEEREKLKKEIKKEKLEEKIKRLEEKKSQI